MTLLPHLYLVTLTHSTIWNPWTSLHPCTTAPGSLPYCCHRHQYPAACGRKSHKPQDYNSSSIPNSCVGLGSDLMIGNMGYFTGNMGIITSMSRISHSRTNWDHKYQAPSTENVGLLFTVISSCNFWVHMCPDYWESTGYGADIKNQLSGMMREVESCFPKTRIKLDLTK